MFSLYKNIIGDNIIVEQFKDSDSPEHNESKHQANPYYYKQAKLFEIPNIPFIPKGKYQEHDTIFSPYKYTYIEGRVYEKIIGEGIIEEHRGCLIIFTDTTNYEVDSKDKTKFKTAKDSLPTDTFYVMITYPFILHKTKAHSLPFGGAYCISKQGDIIKEIRQCQEDFYTNHWRDWILSFLRFINLPNIKIETEDVPNKDAKHYKRNKSNQTHYHILSVKKPTYSKTKNVKAAEQKETLRPLHQVRGHLADYTKGKGLFGKYKIRLWMPEHCRGDLQYGKVNKDYRIKK